MRITITITLLLSVLSGLNAQDSLNVTDSKGLKQGQWSKKHESGKIRYKGQFIDDQPVGEFIYYDYYGNKTTRIVHSEKDSADVTFYHKNGVVMGEGKYYKQQKSGKWKFYDADGDIASQEFYKDGLRHGPARIYYKDGRITRDCTFENGLEQGPLKEYFGDGQLKFEATYLDGNPDGPVKYYHPNGKLRTIGQYQHAVPNGEWIHYGTDGKPSYYEVFKDGLLKKTLLPEDRDALQNEGNGDK